MDSFSIEAVRKSVMKVSATTASRRRIGAAAALMLAGLALGGCNTAKEVDVTASIPTDYRLRHPISIQEADRKIDIFIGTARGGLEASQQADVMAFAQAWRGEATGGIIVDVPTGTANARAAQDAWREIRSIFNAVGVPPRSVAVRPYRPSSPEQLATIKLRYPKMAANAGPCGLWPEDLGPTWRSPIYTENRTHYNFGCASQRNLAAMVANPADLAQPRPEAPPYTGRRMYAYEKYRRGELVAQTHPDAERAKLSDVGK
jgi:pilus assembly protein CpaD